MAIDPAEINDLKIITLCGGASDEREVSIDSGKNVHDALTSIGLASTLLILEEDKVDALAEHEFDIIFNALHGGWGEGGELQAELDERDIVYTGSGATACEMALDKLMTKERFQRYRVPTPSWWALKSSMHVASMLGLSCVSLPSVVKPVHGGSSQGVTIVRSEHQLADAVVKAGKYDDDVMVEAFVDGREFTVGMLDGRALPVIELKAKAEFYDYHAKYESEDTEYLFSTDLDPVVLSRLEKAGLAACKAVGAEHLARADILLDAENRAYVLEVNTIPGFTTHSLLPKAAEKAGISFPQLCRRILELAWQRHRG